MTEKFKKMTEFLPSLYHPETNPYVRGLLYAWSTEDDSITDQIQQAKGQIYVKHAEKSYLDMLGSNVGVFRPAAVNLTDSQFRDLIPTLSFSPKQVRFTILKVLKAFFGENDPRIQVIEIGPSLIKIQIPSSVPSLRRSLTGSHHFNSNSGMVTTVDDTFKTITVSMYGDKVVREDEYTGGRFSQGTLSVPILSNSAGSGSVLIQFSASVDLSSAQAGQRFIVADLSSYSAGFIPDKTKSFSVTRFRGTLTHKIDANVIKPSLTLDDASNIPDTPGRLVFGYGRGGEEADIRYFGRPNNRTLLLDPAYIFKNEHDVGEMVNVIVKPYHKPKIDGSDLSVYLVGVTAARMLAQQIVESVVAAGVTIRWEFLEPEFKCCC